MVGYKNTETVTFKVDVKVKKKLDDIGGVWGIDRSAVVRSFVLACLYNLGRDIPYWVNREQTKVAGKAKRVDRVVELSNRELNVEAEDEVGVLEEVKHESENYDDGLPKKDRKGNTIPEETWHFAVNHGNFPCPCGSGKKTKQCHGKGMVFITRNSTHR